MSVDRSPEWLAKHYKRLKEYEAQQRRDIAKMIRLQRHIARRAHDINQLEEYGRNLDN